MTDPIDLEAIEKRLAAIVLPTESDPHLYRLDPTEGCWIAYKPVDCVGEEELPENPTDLAALVAEVKKLRERVCEHAKCPGGSLCCCDNTDQISIENVRLRAVAEAAQDLKRGRGNRGMEYVGAFDRMCAALEAWESGR